MGKITNKKCFLITPQQHIKLNRQSYFFMDKDVICIYLLNKNEVEAYA